MQHIFNFVIKNKTFLLFLLLFVLALALTIQSHSYHRSKFINSANSITGGIYGTFNGMSQYLDLKTQNQILVEENKLLRHKILNNATATKNPTGASNSIAENYSVIPAEIYKNSFRATNNFLTINKGLKDSIQQDYGVISSKGIVGIIDNTSNKYATVLSVLSKNSKINAKIKTNNQIGSLTWDGKSPYVAQLEDISKFAKINVGDTIITGGESAIFPKGIGIGTIENFETDVSGDTYTIDVSLFNDMTTLQHVYILINKDKEEIKTLEASNDQ